MKENLQLIVEALEKGIRHGIFNNLEIRSIQSCIHELSESTSEEEEVEDDGTKPPPTGGGGLPPHKPKK